MRDPQEVFEMVPMAAIREPTHQLRINIDSEKLGELADSIAAEGLHQPIGLRGPDGEGTYEIVWGHRRYLAHRLLLRESISSRIFPRDFDPLLAAISENLQRVDLDPIEEAKAAKTLLDQGKPIAEIARLFRRSQAWVSARLALLGYHADIITAIREHGLKLSVADALQDIDHDGYRAELIREAIRTGASGPTAQIWRQHYLADRERIVTNQMVVEEVINRREAWVVYVPCQGCGHDTDYRKTTAWRFCDQCTKDLETAILSRPTDTPTSPAPSAATACSPALV